MRTEDDFELKVVGRIPDALAGAILPQRTQSAVRPAGSLSPHLRRRHDPRLLPRAEQSGGRTHGPRRYRNRWVRTPRWQAENKAGRQLFGCFGDPSDPSVANVDRSTANINIVHHAGKLMALHEHSEPFELDPEGLNAAGS